MPKLKQTQREKMDNSFRAAVAGGMELHEIDFQRLTMSLRVSKATFRRHRNDPSMCSLGELRALCSVLRLTPKQLCDICGVKYD